MKKKKLSSTKAVKLRANRLLTKAAVAAQKIKIVSEQNYVAAPDFATATLAVIATVDPLLYHCCASVTEQHLKVLLANQGFRRVEKPARIELEVPHLWMSDDQSVKIIPSEIVSKK